jgi:hypothetical protein
LAFEVHYELDSQWGERIDVKRTTSLEICDGEINVMNHGCRLTNVRDFPVPRHASAKIEVCVHFQPTRKGEVMSNVTTVGIDLAKNVFSLHGVDANGAVVLRKTVSRARLMELVAQQPVCLIGLEACSGAHEWGAVFRRSATR